MNTFILIEKENFNSEREGISFTAKNLTGAKIKASKLQCFDSTILELTDETGHTLAIKEKSDNWINQTYLK